MELKDDQATNQPLPNEIRKVFLQQSGLTVGPTTLPAKTTAEEFQQTTRNERQNPRAYHPIVPNRIPRLTGQTGAVIPQVPPTTMAPLIVTILLEPEPD